MTHDPIKRRHAEESVNLTHLLDAVEYRAEDGALVWRERPVDHFSSEKVCRIWNSRSAGKPAFSTKASSGYLRGRFEWVEILAHRVVWLIHYGRWPADQVDDINGIKTDNRIENLREATRSENLRNTSAYSNNTSGYKGVSFHKSNGKWRAIITLNGKRHQSKGFDKPEDAYAAYLKMAEEKHGVFARKVSR